jgi:hypothetical protein
MEEKKKMSYGGHEAKFYYVAEAVYGRIPVNPAMVGVETPLSIEPSVNPANIKLRGTGTRDLSQIKKGSRQTNLKVYYVVPISGASDLLNFIISLDSLAIEVVYEKLDPARIFDLRFTGCKIDKATVECSVDDVMKAAIEFIGQNMIPEAAKISGATYNEYAGAIPFNETYVSKGAGDGSLQVVLDTVTDWKWNVENNLKRVPVIRLDPSSLLTDTAAAAQKVVKVADGSVFGINDPVEIKDDDNWERNVIDTVATNDLTMLHNLAYTYTVAKAAKTTALTGNLLKYLQERHRNTTGELVFEFEDRDEYWDVVNDFEFSLKIGLGGAKYALFTHCKWDNVATPTKEEDLVSVKAPFTAREVVLA